MVLYLPTMALLSYIGGRDFGGIGLLPYGPDMAVVAAGALAFYYWGVNSGWRTRYLDAEHDARAVADMEAAENAPRGKLAGQQA